MPKFRKKPVVIEAVQLTWNNWNEVCEFANVGKLSDGKPSGGYVDADGNFSDIQDPDSRMGLAIPTLEGVMIATEGDWIIRGVKNGLYPCKPDIFAATYDAVEGGAK